MQFELKINLGDDAMRTPNQIRSALESVLDKLPAEEFRDMTETPRTMIRDENGAVVGAWSVDAG